MTEVCPVRILLVDDDELFRESLSMNLVDAGFAVSEAETGVAALALLAAPPLPDLVLLDWKMPGMNGIEALRRMRESGLTLPVIFLTALSNQIYEEAALQGGAVDFVEKTRSFGILLKRINLILAGAKGAKGAGAPAPAEAAGAGRVGGLELRRDSHRAFWNGREVPLSVTEFKMVELLVAETGRDVSYRALYDLVHGDGFSAGYGEEGYRGNVRAFMKRIRRKFRELDENFDEIESYSGFGYRWRKPGGAGKGDA
jgi:two-component system, OmpR family, response regulator ChvI